MAGIIVVDRIESDASYASSINIASTIQFSNTITGNVNIDSGTLFVDSVGNRVGIGTQNPVGEVHVSANGASIDLQTTFNSNYANIRFKGAGGAVSGQIGGFGSLSGVGLYAGTNEYFRLTNNATFSGLNASVARFGKYYTTSVTIADDATLQLSGYLGGSFFTMIYELNSGSNAGFYHGYGGTPTKVAQAYSGYTWYTADTDGGLCVYTSGHDTFFKNRSGISLSFYITQIGGPQS